ncbi:MAG: prepilin-type N-terminal cleavage/methylation domain-containing protein [Planctomycetota bacterium]
MTPSHSPRRRGFTLIELLITVTVIIILLGATYTLASRAIDGDRVSGAARQVRSMLEGGRDRAIFATKKSNSSRPHGVRLIEDPNRPGTCSELIFVGVPEPIDLPGDVNLTNGTFAPDNVGRWTELFQNGTLGRRQIDDTGGEAALQARYFATIDFDNRNAVTPLVVEIEFAAGANPTFDATAGQSPPDRSTLTPISYLVTMSIGRLSSLLGTSTNGTARPRFEPTAISDEPPRRLPRNVVIDLSAMYLYSTDVEILPESWRRARVVDGNAGGVPTIATTPTDATSVAINNRRDDRITVTDQLDILFSSRGTVTGDLGGTGILMLPLVDVRDLDAGFDFATTALNTTNPTPQVVPLGATADRERRGDERIVCVATQTGVTFSAAVNPSDANNDGIRDDPFSLAERGRQTR